MGGLMAQAMSVWREKHGPEECKTCQVRLKCDTYSHNGPRCRQLRGPSVETLLISTTKLTSPPTECQKCDFYKALTMLCYHSEFASRVNDGNYITGKYVSMAESVGTIPWWCPYAKGES
jgi:hypothetical protein